MNDDFGFFRGAINAVLILFGAAAFVALAVWISSRVV